MKCTVNNKSHEICYTTVFAPPYNRYQKCNYVICNIDDELNIELEYDKPVTKAVVRPLSADISYTWTANKVCVNLKEAANISVEINDEIDSAVLVFANGKRENVQKKYTNFIKFEKGVHFIDELVVDQDNTAIYIAEDAVVNGRLIINDAKNIGIFGNGIITMKNYSRHAPEKNTRCIDITNCQNVQIYDIGVFDSSCWSLRLTGCDGVDIENVKIIGCRGNSDGIDVCGSRNVHVSRCFIRTYDDSFVVKGFDTGNVENVIFEKSVLWNDMARAMEVGVELRCEEVKDIIFRDIDVIHSLTCYPIFGIHHGDRAQLRNIRYENIRIEHAPGGQLFDFRITDSVWNRDSKTGNIQDVYIDKIYLIGNEGKDFRNLSARIETAAAEGTIKNIHIGEINAYGKPISGKQELGLEISGNVENVVFDNPNTGLGYLESKLETVKDFSIGDDGLYHGSVKLIVTNHMKSNAVFEGGIKVYPKHKAEYNGEPAQYALKPGETSEREYDIIAPPGKIAVKSYGNIIEFKESVKYMELDYILKKDINKAMDMDFDNYDGDDYGKIRFALSNGWFTVQADILKECDLKLYTALPCDKKDNQIMFSVEESYFGEAPSVKWENNAYKAAPEIGNPYEITYVFKNQPDVEIKEYTVCSNFDGMLKIPAESLNIGERDFWLEVCIMNHKKKHIPDTLFRSPLPEESAHMFCRFVLA